MINESSQVERDKPEYAFRYVSTVVFIINCGKVIRLKDNLITSCVEYEYFIFYDLMEVAKTPATTLPAYFEWLHLF